MDSTNSTSVLDLEIACVNDISYLGEVDTVKMWLVYSSCPKLQEVQSAASTDASLKAIRERSDRTMEVFLTGHM